MASFAGRSIRASELGLWFLRTYRREALASLSKLIGVEIVQKEADRLGLSCPADHLAQARREALEALERDAAVVYGLGTPVERYVQLRFQQGLEEHLNQRIEDERQRWLFSRIIRFEGLRTDQVDLSLIVTDDRAAAEDAASRLDAGADFARVAERFSVHESKQQGGRLPVPLPREALQPEIADRAFALTAGQRSEILEVDDGSGRRQFEILRLHRMIPGRPVGWSEAQAEVEQSLAERPVDPMEWTAWYLRLERLYNVRVSSNL